MRLSKKCRLKPVRMNTRRYWIVEDGYKKELKLMDELYFKFAYMCDDIDKINVHFPMLSIDEKYEIEKKRRLGKRTFYL